MRERRKALIPFNRTWIIYSAKLKRRLSTSWRHHEATMKPFKHFFFFFFSIFLLLGFSSPHKSIKIYERRRKLYVSAENSLRLKPLLGFNNADGKSFLREDSDVRVRYAESLSRFSFHSQMTVIRPVHNDGELIFFLERLLELDDETLIFNSPASRVRWYWNYWSIRPWIKSLDLHTLLVVTMRFSPTHFFSPVNRKIYIFITDFRLLKGRVKA